ncbi:carboxypeptidase regulatory-like domain-containing protein [Silvibacterium acidisoli]|uniref:carboxypeptidase regulatory-like domain-containing protein n=1 Tax=Acidobacteriaceae bacterium ZG23-2 TaxID=2883246 RepID=UPI00406CB522
MKHRFTLLGTSVLSAVVCFSGMAQTITGSINGTVTDPSGAIIPNATVTARNIDTGVETKATTNGSGDYNLRFLQIGHYQVTIGNPGFANFVSSQFTLEVNQIAKIDAKLAPGNATQTVTVSGNLQPILDTDNATLAGTFTANTIQNMPLNGRNFSSATEFLPGAVVTNPAGMTGQNAIERDTNQGGQVSVNGNRNQTNSYLLDGVEINETINNVIGYNPSPDAIENLTVITSNAAAEYGNVNGGDVIAVIKSGGNQYHGSAFGFLQNANLDANSWGNNFAGNPKQPFTQTVFGGTVGGRIMKDKLFFFADYEGARYQTGGTQTVSVIPQAFRNGDFSSLGTQLYHWVNGVRLPYANNQVPVTNPVAAFLFAHPELYPLPNQAPTSHTIAQNNYIGAYHKTERNDQGDIKIDWHYGAKDVLAVRYSQGEASDATPETPIAITFPTTNSYPFKGLAINEVHTFSPSIVNEFRAGWSRVRWVQGTPVDTTGQFGTKGDSIVGINFPNQPCDGFTAQSWNSNGGSNNLSYLTGVGTDCSGSSLINNIFTYGDNLTMELGKHTLKMGTEIVRYQQNNFYPGNDGIMGNEEYGGSFTGNDVSDFLANDVYYAGVSADVGRSGQRQYRDGFFFQDDWKATDKLTLNLGLRWEYDQPIYEVNDKQANVDLATGQYYYAGTAAAAKVFGDGHALYHPTYTNFMPRIGFAYQPKDRWVIRGGYGITNFLEGTGANLRLNFNPPFQPAYQYTALQGSATTAGTPLTAENALPANISGSTGANTLRAWDSNLRPAFIQEFTLSAEYQLSNQTSVSVGYVGQTGQHLVDARAANQLTAPGAVAPYFNLVGQSGSIVETQSNSMMNYNGMQVTVRHREHNGVEYTVNYTYAKALSNNPGFYGANSGGNISNDYGPNYSAYWQNAYNGHADYGPSSMDVRHNLNATGVYELPFGRGKRYGTNMNRWIDEAAGGWKLTGTAIVYSGLPVTVSGPNYAAVNSGSARANQYRKLVVRNRSIANWFGNDPSATPCDPTTAGSNNGACAYGPEATGEFGSAANGSERAPGFEQIDLSAGKAFKITESQNIEYRADFFNAFNIASYNYPDANISDSTFGQINDTRSQPRIIQMSLHYNF